MLRKNDWLQILTSKLWALDTPAEVQAAPAVVAGSTVASQANALPPAEGIDIAPLPSSGQVNSGSLLAADGDLAATSVRFASAQATPGQLAIDAPTSSASATMPAASSTAAPTATSSDDAGMAVSTLRVTQVTAPLSIATTSATASDAPASLMTAADTTDWASAPALTTTPLAAPMMASSLAITADATMLAATAATNPIVDENTLHRTSAAQWQALGMTAGGTPKDVWDVRPSNQIEGFTTDISYNLGQTVQFKINVNGTAAATLPYRIEIFRLGYYGGDGATLVATLNNADGTVQPNPIKDGRGLVDAGNWSVTDSWAIPTTATSGVYVARIDRLDASGKVIQGAANQIPFIVRNDAGTSDIVLQTSDTTWQAYNAWAGNNGQVGANLYDGGAFPKADAVSYNRPFLDRLAVGQGAGPQDYLFGADYAAIYWLEKNGYNVSYISGVDTDRLGAAALEQHKAFISVGHDEYWSGGQRANVTAARDAGVNLMFFSGNDVYWKTRYEASIAGTPTSYRTLVCYKETAENLNPNAPASAYNNADPSNEWTGTWRDMRFVNAVDANGVRIATGQAPENSLTGQLYVANGEGQFGAALDVPQTYTGLRQWRGTAVQNSAGTFDIAPGIIGYEWDASPVDANRPAGLIKISETTIPWGSVLQDQGNTYAAGTPTHALSVYRAPSGALVFGTGTVFWSWGLSDQHEQYAPYSQAAYIESPIIKQLTVNMLADMGIQAGSLEAGLIAATASADKTPATTTLKALPATVAVGQTVAMSGTATDPNAAVDHGVVALVEVSFNNGQTWTPAIGTNTWSYQWQPTAPGTYQIKVRAIDDSLNAPIAFATQTVTVTGPTASESFFAAGATPSLFILDAWDPTNYELGMKFSAKVAGTITDLKYFRGAVDADNVDTRTLHLWDAANATTPLATVTISSAIGASGWQTAHLTTPVHITANKTYIVSYGTTENYAKSDAYFTTVQTDAAGHITTPIGAGVYAVGPGGFPSAVSGNSNYWADVTFVPDSGASTNHAPTVSGPVTAAATEDTGTVQVNLLAKAADVDGDALHVAGLTGLTGGITLSGDTLVVDTAAFQSLGAGATRAIPLSYSIVDGKGGTVAETATVTLTGVNDAPTGSPTAVLPAGTSGQAYTVSAATLLAGFSDVDSGDTLTVSGLAASSGTVTLSGSTYTITQAAGFTGSVKLTYGVSDGHGGLLSGKTLSYSVGGATSGTPENFFAAGATPSLFILDAWDPTDYELGMKFSANVAGNITDLKYYRGAVDADNVDTRTLHLWDAANTTTPLATVTISSAIGASGWQTAHLTTPVHITANKTYIVSYGTTENYAKTDAYFATAQTDAAGHITAPIGAGVYAVGPGGFPNAVSGNSNYWADVTFVPDATATTAATTTTAAAAPTALMTTSTAAPSAPAASTVTVAVDNVRDVITAANPTGDTIGYSSYKTALGVDLASSTAIDGTAARYSIVNGSGADAAHSDAITGFQNFIGGVAADTITANASRNVLTGGAGNDTFIFTSAVNAGGTTGTAAARAASRDVVTDFSDGGDVVDIAQIAHGTAGAWTFDGKVAASSSMAAGHVHYFIDASGNTIIEGQSSTTSGVSFQIQLNGQHVLTAQSFHL